MFSALFDFHGYHGEVLSTAPAPLRTPLAQYIKIEIHSKSINKYEIGTLKKFYKIGNTVEK